MAISVPWNIWEKQLIGFSDRNFSCHKTHHFKPKLVLQVEQVTDVELLMLALGLVVN